MSPTSIVMPGKEPKNNMGLTPKRSLRDPYFVGVNEAAYLMGSPPKTIRKWIACGILDARKVGGSVKIPIEAIKKAGRPLHPQNHVDYPGPSCGKGGLL